MSQPFPTPPADQPTEFSDQFQEDARRLVLRYPVARSALLPLLHLVQSEHGYVTAAGVAFCAETLRLSKAEVAAVATFYTMYKRAPVGDYLLSVCTNPTCQVAGAQVIYDRYHDELGGSHDPETGVSIEEAECLGICDAAPVVQVNYDMFGPVTDDEADRLLAACRSGEPPVSTWSGEAPPTFREVERELSGADDAFGDHLVAAAHHAVANSEVAPSYKTGMTDLPVTHPGGDPAGHGGAIFAAEFAGTGSAAADDGDPDDGDQVDTADAVQADAAADESGHPEAADVADAAEEAADTDGVPDADETATADGADNVAVEDADDAGDGEVDGHDGPELVDRPTSPTDATDVASSADTGPPGDPEGLAPQADAAGIIADHPLVDDAETVEREA